MNTYKNPIKRQGDFADPFVLRHNGRYYLYATNPDIRCWSSSDLINWKPEGPVIGPDEFPGLVPFAPEVVYSNGAFYMYTSPSGFGHYVLKSERPTGPFRKITGNVGHNIDGSVFIDEDDQWYFFWADDAGILCCKMDGPDAFGEPVNTGAYLHGWTEGPMVLKVDGLYYMTYTGNHYLSPGYRICAAVSEHPQGPYRECANNPTLVHTTGKNIGLGHSSTVLGPDLCTYYIVYHNLNPDQTRDLDLDVIEMRDGHVQVAGPSREEQVAPALPTERYDPAEPGFAEKWTITAGEWECKGEYAASKGNVFRCERQLLTAHPVIELNLLGRAPVYGVTLGGVVLEFSAAENELLLRTEKGGTLFRRALPDSYVHHALHRLILRCLGDTLQIELDHQKAVNVKMPPESPLILGLFAQGGSVGMGRCTVAEGCKKSEFCFAVPCQVRPADELLLNAPQAGEYWLSVQLNGPTEQAPSLTYSHGGQEHHAVLIRRSRDLLVYQLTLPQGMHRLSLDFHPQLCAPLWYSFHPRCEEPRFSARMSLPGPFGKTLADVPAACDCTVSLSFDQSPEGLDGGEIGLLFRASEEAKGGEGNDERLGINFFIGYCAALRDDLFVLTKHRYDSRELAHVSAKGCRKITVRAQMNDILICLDDQEHPALSFHDPDPILYGKAGIRAAGAALKGAVLQSE